MRVAIEACYIYLPTSAGKRIVNIMGTLGSHFSPTLRLLTKSEHRTILQSSYLIHFIETFLVVILHQLCYRHVQMYFCVAENV